MINYKERFYQIYSPYVSNSFIFSWSNHALDFIMPYRNAPARRRVRRAPLRRSAVAGGEGGGVSVVAGIYINIYKYIYVYIYIYMCMYMYVYMYMYICMSLYKYIYVYIYMYIYMSIHTYTQIYIYKYMYVYIYIFKQARPLGREVPPGPGGGK
jgi:hypothetical protein